MCIKKIISLLLIITFISSTVFADPGADVVIPKTSTSSGTFTLLSKGFAAPFNGALFDSKATATIIADKDVQATKCKIQLEVLNETAKTQCKFNTDILQLKLNTEEKVHLKDNEIKDKEIQKLEKIAENKSDYTLFYIGGGFIGGVLVTLGIVWAATKVTK